MNLPVPSLNAGNVTGDSHGVGAMAYAQILQNTEGFKTLKSKCLGIKLH